MSSFRSRATTQGIMSMTSFMLMVTTISKISAATTRHGKFASLKRSLNVLMFDVEEM